MKDPCRKIFDSKKEIGSVLFLGDTATADKTGPMLQKFGYSYPYSKTHELLASHDAVVANLETAVTTSTDPWWLWKKWTYKMHPNALPALKNAGVDAVTLANNHVYDYGSSGLKDTLKHLDDVGIAHLGAGMSEAEARQGLVIETSGGRLGVLSYIEDCFVWRMWTGAIAFDTPFHNWAGSARIDSDDLKDDIARMRKFCDAVVVVVHWGENYQRVNGAQKKIGRLAIDLGAEAVIGHNPHQFQPVALYRGRPVIYSLGNYVFGSTGRDTMRFGMGATLILKEGHIQSVEFTPLLTQNRIVKFRPYIPKDKRLQSFFTQFISESANHGANVIRRGDTGHLIINPASNVRNSN